MSEPAAPRLQNIDGVVKWFDSKKGFGFIVGPEEQDIFCHYTVIEGEGFRILRDGASVNYDAERGSDGRWRAARVRRLDAADDGATSGVVVVPRRPRPSLRTPRL